MQQVISIILVYAMLVQACGSPSSSDKKPTSFGDANPVSASNTTTFGALNEPIEIICDQAVNGALFVNPSLASTWNFTARNSTGSVPITSITASPQPTSMTISGGTVTFTPTSASDYTGTVTVVAGNGTATTQKMFSWSSNSTTTTTTSSTTSLTTMLLPMMLMMLPTVFSALGGLFSGGAANTAGASGAGGSTIASGGGGCANGQCGLSTGGGATKTAATSGGTQSTSSALGNIVTLSSGQKIFQQTSSPELVAATQEKDAAAQRVQDNFNTMKVFNSYGKTSSSEPVSSQSDALQTYPTGDSSAKIENPGIQ